MERQNVLTAEEKKLHASDKRQLLAADFIGQFVSSKNPRRQRLGVLLQALRLLKAQSPAEFTAAAERLGCQHAQSLAFLGQPAGPGQQVCESTMSSLA